MTRGEAGSSPQSPLQLVSGLLRDPLISNEESGVYDPISTLDRIAAMHGARFESVVRLARDGAFSGGLVPDLEDPTQREFFATPNLGYDWENNPHGHEIAEDLVGSDFDVVELAIAYSESREDEDLGELSHEELYREHLAAGNGHIGNGVHVDDRTPTAAVDDLSHGVVIAFTGDVLSMQPTPYVSVDYRTGDDELVLPEVPSIHTIEGIYPVNAAVARALKAALKELRA
jgi:hypothetical protein